MAEDVAELAVEGPEACEGEEVSAVFFTLEGLFFRCLSW